MQGNEPIIAIMAFIVIIWAVVTTTRNFSYNQLRQACDIFHQESKRETKFVEYTYWRQDCLTPQANGLWISTMNLRGD